MWHFYGKLVNRLPFCFRHPNRIFLSNGKHPCFDLHGQEHLFFFLSLNMHGPFRWVKYRSPIYNNNNNNNNDNNNNNKMCSQHEETVDHIVSGCEVFSACTVTQWKIKMQTIQYRRTRIWEMKKDKYTKPLPRIRSVKYFKCEILGKFIKLCMETPCWCPFQEHQYGRRIPTETSVFEFSY